MDKGVECTDGVERGTGSERPKVVYQVQTPFKDLHLPTFFSLGACFYMLEQVITHPTEVIRTRLQVERHIRSSWILVMSLVREAGWRGLYPGFWPTVVGHMPGSGVYLFSYSYMKDRLQQIEDRRSSNVDGRQASWVSFTSAAVSDTISILLTCPVDVVVQRLYIRSPEVSRTRSVMSICRGIWRQHGLRGFYLGSGLTFVNYVPASAIWWTMYENLKAVFSRLVESRRRKEASDSFVAHKHSSASMLAGGVSGAVVTLLTNPLDVVKTRIQVEETGLQRAVDRQSALRVIRNLYKVEGVAGFMKGLGPRIYLWIFFSVYSAMAYETIIDVSSAKKRS
ncbi:uncharacterized protein LOC126318303 [Schistocerca gregaria]|uniref:uncharacterized protein LOC126318303 n=1 Tax=Schistocerca gregaria TaxID=7010 RepID=UPI00211E5B61|nr:uncharacterized protein LOC126318303 [Schistocerca gregaria]